LAKSKTKDFTVRVCIGSGGLASGSQDVITTFEKELTDRGLGKEIEKKCVDKNGCRGFCAKDVLVDVIIGKDKNTYQYIKPEYVARIVDEHIIGGEPVKEWLVGPDYHDFHDKQTKIILSQCGKINPEEIDAYIAVGGYKGAKKALKLDPFEVVEEVKESGLRGRGGGGFPTGLKWDFCSRAPGTKKYIICNAFESAPGAFMDRSVIEGNPHAIVEGLIIGGYAIGANEGIIYTRKEYHLTRERIGNAIDQARERGYLGKHIFKSRFDFDIQIKLCASAFIGGEETSLVASIEGKRGVPKAKPPFLVHKGLWGKPTSINNVETLANIPTIINRGASWYSDIGTTRSSGTKVFALSGSAKNTGLIEVPMGITLREIIYDIGGGMARRNRKFKAVQTGGPTGGCISEEHIDMPVNYESLMRKGSIMGSGSMVVMDDRTCMVDMTKYFLSITESESCGKCTPCRIGSKRMYEILTRISEGRGRDGDIDLLIELGTSIRLSSLCGFGRSLPNPVLSTISNFKDEYDAHIKDGRCPARACKSLREYKVSNRLCKMCGKCYRVCPSGAIDWEKKQKALINKTQCIKCGACYEACPFDAIL
jgi:NADH-quinone oxidoreductase subunit F